MNQVPWLVVEDPYIQKVKGKPFESTRVPEKPYLSPPDIVYDVELLQPVRISF